MKFTPARLFAAQLRSGDYLCELAAMDRCIEELRRKGTITRFELDQDEPADWFDPNLHHFHLELDLKDGRTIEATGVHRSREAALSIAYGEALERYCLLARTPIKSCYRFANKRNIEDRERAITSNGLAFHPNLYRSFLAAFGELVERHVMLRAWYSKTPAKFRLGVSELDFLDPARRHCAEHGSSFEVLLLDEFGPFFVVCILARSDNAKIGFRVACSFAADLDLHQAIERAYREWALIVRSKPILHYEERFRLPDGVTKMSDHLYFHQSEGAAERFDFLLVNIKERNHAALLRKRAGLLTVLGFARSCDLRCYFYVLPEGLKGFSCIRVASPLLLQLKFGREHANIDRRLLGRGQAELDLTLPHPLA